jgi:hypothetical protein
MYREGITEAVARVAVGGVDRSAVPASASYGQVT